MPRKRPRRPTATSRHLLVARWRASVGSHYRDTYFGPHSTYLHFHGRLDEPLRGITDAELQISPDLDWETSTSAGMIIGIKPRVQFVISVPPFQFERLWQLAAACRSIHLSFAEPKWGKAKITGWHASTNVPDEDE